MNPIEFTRQKLRKIRGRIRKRRKRGSSARDLKRVKKRLEKKLAWLEDHRDPEPSGNGTAPWRGRQVAAWMVGAARGPDGKRENWLERSVRHGWDGNLSSGYRSPEYSDSLCRAMCGAPSCPGRCAGRASNHSQTGPPNWGAIDVWPQYSRFGQIQREIGSPLRNALGSVDPVHYSYTGR